MKKIGSIALAGAVALTGLTVFGGGAAEEAVAGVLPTCDAGVVTLTKTDDADGSVLAGATFEIPAKAGVFFKEGTSTAADEQSFREAFNAEFGVLTTTEAGQALDAVYVDKLGDHPGFPNDITGLSTSNDAIRAEVLKDWQAKATVDGTALQKMIADLDTRIELVDKALDLNTGLEAGDPVVYKDLTDTKTSLDTMKERVDSMISTTDWATFVEDYKFVTNVGNWKLGLGVEVSAKYVDILNGHDNKTKFDEANGKAAETVGASETITITTDENGQAQFSVFGVDFTYGDNSISEVGEDGNLLRGNAATSRGSNTCIQIAGILNEVLAPDGYVLDQSDESWAFDPDADGDIATTTMSVTNTKVDPVVPPKDPIRNNGGI